jgi:hypothetical protein
MARELSFSSRIRANPAGTTNFPWLYEPGVTRWRRMRKNEKHATESCWNGWRRQVILLAEHPLTGNAFSGGSQWWLKETKNSA